MTAGLVTVGPGDLVTVGAGVVWSGVGAFMAARSWVCCPIVESFF